MSTEHKARATQAAQGGWQAKCDCGWAGDAHAMELARSVAAFEAREHSRNPNGTLYLERMVQELEAENTRLQQELALAEGALADVAPEDSRNVEVSPHVANQVLHYLNPREGYRPGSFMEALYRAFSHADYTNFSRLWDAFPEQGMAMHLGTRTLDGSGVDTLRRIANGGDLS